MALKPHHQAEMWTELGRERFLKELTRERFLKMLEVEQALTEQKPNQDRALKKGKSVIMDRESEQQPERERIGERVSKREPDLMERERDFMNFTGELNSMARELEGRMALSNFNYAVFLPNAFDIVWGNDARYWRLPKRDAEDPAELVKVSWLEVSGKLHNIELGKKYEISFRVSWRSNAFDWSNCPIYLMAKIGKKGKYDWTKIQLDKIPTTPCNDHEIEKSIPAKIPQEKKFEIEVPISLDDDNDRILYFGLYEVWTGIAKEGLLIYNAIVKKVN